MAKRPESLIYSPEEIDKLAWDIFDRIGWDKPYTVCIHEICIAQAKALLKYLDDNGLLAHRGERLGVCDSTCEACKLKQEVGE